MFYKVYSNNESFKIPGFKPITLKNQYAPVETGGSFKLIDGDILYIEPQWAEISDSWSGIVYSLESGERTCAYHINLDADSCYQSSKGFFWMEDLHPFYEEGVIMKIYKSADNRDWYDYVEGWSEENIMASGGYLVGVFKIISTSDGLQWMLLDPTSLEFTKYNKTSIKLKSYDDILTITGLSCVDKERRTGFCYYLESGMDSTGFYYSPFKYDNGKECYLQQTSSGWFDYWPEKDGMLAIYPTSDFEIVYSCINTDDWNENPEEVVRRTEAALGITPILLRYDGYRWILEDEGQVLEEEELQTFSLWGGQDLISISKAQYLWQVDVNDYGIYYTLDSGRFSLGLFYYAGDKENITNYSYETTAYGYFGTDISNGDQVHIYTSGDDSTDWYTIAEETGGEDAFSNTELFIETIQELFGSPTILEYNGTSWVLVQEGTQW